jgi:uncharacterized protein YndB with AHSA1/START domain
MSRRWEDRTMATGQASVQIARPVRDVFGYASDPANMPRWAGEVLEAELLTPGPLGVGSQARGVGKLLGRRLEVTIQVTAFEPGRTFAFVSVAGPVRSENRLTFAEVDGGTRVTETVEAELAGFLGLADPLVGRALNRQFETNLANLKDLLEAEVESPTPVHR